MASLPAKETAKEIAKETLGQLSEPSDKRDTLSKLLQHPSLWQSTQQANALPSAIPSGFNELDNVLHCGGWPNNGCTELLVDHAGIGELSLLFPALQTLSAQQPEHWVALLAPPYIPYAPALAAAGIKLPRLLVIQPHNLADKLWSCEQLLRSGHFHSVISWFDEHALKYAQQRKLQLAAQEQQSWFVSFRSPNTFSHSSPARLRIQLHADKHSLHLHILKQQGGWAGQQLNLPRPESLLQCTLDVNQWISKDALARYPLTLTASGNIHPSERQLTRLRSGSPATNTVRKHTSTGQWRAHQQHAEHSLGTEPKT